jgi:O-methyltransferase
MQRQHDDIREHAALPRPGIGRLRAKIAALVQQAPAVWRSYEFCRALTAIRSEDVPYLWEMLRVMRTVAPLTAGGPRLVSLFRLANRVSRSGIPGDIVECGCARGGTAALLGMASRHSRKHLWLFDSFEGLPPADEIDGSAAAKHVGSSYGSTAEVESTLRRLGISETRTHLVPGWFQDTLSVADVRSIALLHIDADWYSSVRTCLETLYERVSSGGYVVLDDYGYWPGCRAAVDEFMQKQCITVPLIDVDGIRRYFRKP